MSKQPETSTQLDTTYSHAHTHKNTHRKTPRKLKQPVSNKKTTLRYYRTTIRTIVPKPKKNTTTKPP